MMVVRFHQMEKGRRHFVPGRGIIVSFSWNVVSIQRIKIHVLDHRSPSSPFTPILFISLIHSFIAIATLSHTTHISKQTNSIYRFILIILFWQLVFIVQVITVLQLTSHTGAYLQQRIRL